MDVDVEELIRWDDLIDEQWNRWTPQKLHQRWIALKKDSIFQVKTTEVGPSFIDISFLTQSSDVVQQLSAQHPALRTSTSTK